MKAFVTGSTGLLGSNLVRQLVGEGYEVKAMARSLTKGQRILGDLDVQLVAGDMQDVAGFAAELADVDVLFHVAAYFREYYQPGAHDDLLTEINVKGTMQLLETAVAQGIDHIVYVSSSGVLTQSINGRPIDERSPYAEETPNLYFQSKIAAEKAIFAFLENHPALRLTMILPGAMMGPGDSGPTAPGQFLLDFLQGKVPMILPGGLAVVDVRDVAQAMVRVVEMGERGERYLVDGRFYDLKTLMTTLSEISGIPSPKIAISYPIAMGVAWGMETISRLTGKPPMLSRQVIQTLQHSGETSSAKALQTFKLQRRPLQETLRDEIAWFKEHGYV